MDLNHTAASASCSRELLPEADAACIADVLNGNKERFSELIQRYQNAVLAAVRGYVQDPHDAEDVAQDVFVNAFSALRQLRDTRLFFPWLLQIARHRAAQSGRNRAKRSIERALTGEEQHVAAPQQATQVTSILACVEQLAEPYRSTLLLKYERGLSCKEIAAKEGVAIGTITSRLTRALMMLRSAFTEGRPP